MYKPGGIKHAAQIDHNADSKTRDVPSDMDLIRTRIDVEAQGLGLKWIRAWPGSQKKNRVEKVILQDVSIRFPAGEVTAILVSK